MEVAKAEADKIRLIGAAEATAIEAVGKAEAERMRLKAAAYRQYGEAAMLNLVLETLPKVCCEKYYLLQFSEFFLPQFNPMCVLEEYKVQYIFIDIQSKPEWPF